MQARLDGWPVTSEIATAAVARLDPQAFTASAFDRATSLRERPEAVAAALADDRTRLLPMTGLQLGISAVAGAAYQLAWQQLGGVRHLLTETPFLLGRDAAGPVFAARVDDAARLDAAFGELREVAASLSRQEASLAAYARALAYWHDRHRFCGACGQPCAAEQGGHVRRCLACSQSHFPRTDPAVIVLITDGDRCVLGRSPRLPARMYSTLAGFVEPGESLEDTVVREMAEEAGVEVGAPHYVGSQPWPFPASLMLGFVVRALSFDLHNRDGELEDVQWFSRDDLDRRKERDIVLPFKLSIARSLIDGWRRGAFDALLNDDLSSPARHLPDPPG